jgi:hypothetical protein
LELTAVSSPQPANVGFVERVINKFEGDILGNAEEEMVGGMVGGIIVGEHVDPADPFAAAFPDVDDLATIAGVNVEVDPEAFTAAFPDTNEKVEASADVDPAAMMDEVPDAPVEMNVELEGETDDYITTMDEELEGEIEEELEGEIDPNTMMDQGIDYRLVLPNIEWSVPGGNREGSWDH